MSEYAPKYDLNSVVRLLNAVEGRKKHEYHAADLIEDRATIDSVVDGLLLPFDFKRGRAISLVYGLPSQQPMSPEDAGKIFYQTYPLQPTKEKARMELRLNKGDEILNYISERYNVKQEDITKATVIIETERVTTEMERERAFLQHQIKGGTVQGYLRWGLTVLRFQGKRKALHTIVKESQTSS